MIKYLIKIILLFRNLLANKETPDKKAIYQWLNAFVLYNV